MGNLNFIPDPKELDIWINDTTRLNASNMNELRRSVENIREFIVNRNGNGIQTEVNRLTDEVEGNPSNTNKRYGSYRTTEKIVRDIYDKQSFHQETGNPSKLSLFGQDFSNGSGSEDYRTQYLDRTYKAYTETPVGGNNVESLSDYDISSGERDKGLVAAAANTQRYADYTRARLIAHENQYRPNSIHFGYLPDNKSEAQIKYEDEKLVLVPNVEINGALKVNEGKETSLGGTLTVSGATTFESSVDIAFPFHRTGSFPIDGSSLFSSLEDASKYALGDGSDDKGLGKTSYIGQYISVWDDNIDDDIRVFVIGKNRVLREIILSDDTIYGGTAADADPENAGKMTY